MYYIYGISGPSLLIVYRLYDWAHGCGSGGAFNHIKKTHIKEDILHSCGGH